MKAEGHKTKSDEHLFVEFFIIIIELTPEVTIAFYKISYIAR